MFVFAYVPVHHEEKLRQELRNSGVDHGGMLTGCVQAQVQLPFFPFLVCFCLCLFKTGSHSIDLDGLDIAMYTRLA